MGAPGRLLATLLVLTAVCSPSPAAAQQLIPERRPTALLTGLGFWLEKAAPSDGLQPAELAYASAALQYEGVTFAQLARLEGSGAASWPQLADSSQCACVKLCFSQNQAALADKTGATPLKCKRWSFRGKGGACRLFGPGGAGVRAVALEGKTAKDQEWTSGTAERYLAQTKPGQVAPGKAPCQFIATGSLGASGLLAGSAMQRSPPAAPLPPRNPGGSRKPPAPPAPSSRKLLPPMGR